MPVSERITFLPRSMTLRTMNAFSSSFLDCFAVAQRRNPGAARMKHFTAVV